MVFWLCVAASAGWAGAALAYWRDNRPVGTSICLVFAAFLMILALWGLS